MIAFRSGRLTRRPLLRQREGSAAVEFAMVALPFAFMVFAILELGLVFVLDSTLENATIEAGRLVRTGQAEKQGMSAAQFKTEVCRRMSIFTAGCTSKVSVDVREVPSFRNPNAPDPITGGAFQDSSLTFNDGSAGSLMLVRVWYRHTLATPFLTQGLSRLGNGQAVLTATTAFRNEPFDQ